MPDTDQTQPELEMQIAFNREILSFGEKISLSKLEVKKAEERTAELEYQLSRFQLEYYLKTLAGK